MVPKDTFSFYNTRLSFRVFWEKSLRKNQDKHIDYRQYFNVPANIRAVATGEIRDPFSEDQICWFLQNVLINLTD